MKKDRCTKDTWKPNATDKMWLKNMTCALREGGIWGVPVSESTFQVWPKAKRFELTFGDELDETNQRIIKCFHSIGFKRGRVNVDT